MVQSSGKVKHNFGLRDLVVHIECAKNVDFVMTLTIRCILYFYFTVMCIFCAGISLLIMFKLNPCGSFSAKCAPAHEGRMLT